ncbi:heme-binding protein [Bradyrhizobium prioriisuperbiae]|uniref:GlcG/HbpS family heme-binding protein n=1 Tax=Bradyrhizobium prioriisuperbiae TaxID=2854389 RepID=UPI0028EB5055|nr:heme-binding protein [Bradyrhizobium prioritasuperba]
MKGLIAVSLAAVALASVARAEEVTVTYKSLSPDVALEAAQAALKRCRTDGYQIAVAVLDRFGEPQVMLRDRFAGLPAPRTATDKAWTALGFRANTSDMVKSIQAGTLDARLATLPRVTMLGGGLIIEAGGTLLGAIGVSGAPGGDKDEACAKAGIDSIRDKLDF